MQPLTEKRKMRHLVVFALVLLAGVVPLGAAPFYLRYDADGVFPEQDGWDRFWDDPDGQLVRTLENGVMRLDTRGSYAIFDYYEIFSDAFVLDEGEELRVTWRMQTFETDAPYGRSDVNLGIVNEFHEYAQFYLAPTYVSEHRLGGGAVEHLYEIEPGVPHTYYVTTSDMQEYDLYVDGAFAFHGHLQEYAWRDVPRVGFGDSTIGLTSLSEWDFVDVTVVPEVSSVMLFASGLVLVFSNTRRMRQ